jgi:Methyltransferase domain
VNYAVLKLPWVSDTTLNYDVRYVETLRHPLFGWLGLRPALAQHTAAEHEAMRKWAAERKTLVEIGVAEGVSAVALRQGMGEDATLTLIDPFHLSRYPVLNFMKRVARRAVEDEKRGKVAWIEDFSQTAVRSWSGAIDLILIDGDHTEAAVERDWNDWSRFVKPGGVALFHDACVFSGGWTSSEYGPVKLVNRLFRDGNVAGWTVAEEVHSLIVIRKDE